MWVCAFALHSYFEVIITREVLSGLPLAALKCIKMGVRYIMEGGGALMCFMLANLSLHNMGKVYKWIGKRSFQVYLFHVPLIQVYRYIVNQWIPAERMSEGLYALLVVVQVFVGLIGVYALQSLIEVIRSKRMKKIT